MVGGVEWRIRLGQKVAAGSPPRNAIVTQLSPRAKITLVHDDMTTTKVSYIQQLNFGNVPKLLLQ